MGARLRPVARAAGDLFPGRIVNLVSVVFDRINPAAPRAAKRDRLSGEAELDFFFTDLALHADPNQPQRHGGTEKSLKNNRRKQID